MPQITTQKYFSTSCIAVKNNKTSNMNCNLKTRVSPIYRHVPNWDARWRKDTKVKHRGEGRDMCCTFCCAPVMYHVIYHKELGVWDIMYSCIMCHILVIKKHYIVSRHCSLTWVKLLNSGQSTIQIEILSYISQFETETVHCLIQIHIIK